MRDRVDQGDGLLLGESASIHLLIEIANPKILKAKEKGWTEEQQVAARVKLHDIYRVQTNEFRRGERGEIDRELWQWATMWLHRVFENPDPVIAMAEFLGRKRKPGKRSKNTDRDFDIAVAVAKKMMLSGLTLEKAVFAVAEDM